MNIKVHKRIADWQAARSSDALAGKSLGFVPTMGALHEGHASLVRRSGFENERTLVSIFVNPTQFNDPKDLDKYPRTLEKDLELLKAAGATDVILPEFEEIYPDGYRYKVSETVFSRRLCGAHRPGHFDGVLTVVMKLLQVAQAERAYFGEKDFQQLTLIEEMARAFFMPVKIIPCPIVREPDGLAMSSRNVNLSADERELAPALYRALSSARPLVEIRTDLERKGFKVDYLEETHGRRFVAATLGAVRLIDNVPLREVP